MVPKRCHHGRWGAPYKRIHQVAFTDAIPTSPSGKTLRRLLVAGEQHRS
jgi:acyl-coenzyme A synthetase/AMP-(fatty) acid ligase